MRSSISEKTAAISASILVRASARVSMRAASRVNHSRVTNSSYLTGSTAALRIAPSASRHSKIFAGGLGDTVATSERQAGCIPSANERAPPATVKATMTAPTTIVQRRVRGASGAAAVGTGPPASVREGSPAPGSPLFDLVMFRHRNTNDAAPGMTPPTGQWSWQFGRVRYSMPGYNDSDATIVPAAGARLRLTRPTLPPHVRGHDGRPRFSHREANFGTTLLGGRVDHESRHDQPAPVASRRRTRCSARRPRPGCRRPGGRLGGAALQCHAA